MARGTQDGILGCSPGTLPGVVTKRWRMSADGVGDGAFARSISRSPLIARLLWRRNIADTLAADRFFNPKLVHLYEPLEMPGMAAAVDRIERALERQESIAVFGDYDVDGISSTCLLCDFFRFIGRPVRYRLPNRLIEGYGLRESAVRELAACGVQLIITVDNGSSAFEEVEIARTLGVDVVVTDHHQPPARLPRAVALVNPWLPGSEYPFKDLAGVGVTFKLVWALLQRLSRKQKLSEEFRNFLLESLSLVALGTISDVVPLLGENRVLAKYGLLALERTRRPGLRTLVDSVLDRATNTRLDASHVGFRLGPRINAAGRLGRAETSIDLLLAIDDGVASELAQVLEGENRKRQTLEREMLETARELVREGVDLSRDRAIVLGREDWHAGVIGIVAARIAEEFSRPTLLLSMKDGRARGSARSVPGVHICDALSSCSRWLKGFGGHEMAAGVEMDSSLLDSFRCALNEAIPLAPAEMLPEIEIDAEVSLGDITHDFLEELSLFEPFGRSNPEPLLVAKGVTIAGQPRLMGEAGKHLCFHARQGGTAHRAVAFHRGELLGEIERPGRRIDLLFHPRLSRWQGRAEIELHVREIGLGELLPGPSPHCNRH